MDNRLQWIGEKISFCLGVQKEFTNNLIQENFDAFKSFMEDELNNIEDIDKKIVFIYRTFYNKLVESTITVLELVPPVPPAEIIVVDKKGKKGKGKKTKDIEDGEVKPDQDFVADETPRLGLATDDTDDKKKKGKKKKKDEPPLVTEPEYIEVSKIVQNYVKTPLLHCYFGPIPNDKIDSKINYLYVIRKNPAKADNYDCYEDCLAELTQRFIFGNLKGNLIYTMKNHLLNVFKKSIESQFREPIETDQNILKEDTKEIKTTNEQTIGIIEFSRPSNYQSITMQKSIKETTAERLKRLIEVKDHISFESSEFKKKVILRKSPLKEILIKNLNLLLEKIDWTVSHVICDFTLPTFYNAPGQENIRVEEEKQKIQVDPYTINVDDLTNEQINYIFNGWIKYIKKFIHLYKEKELIDFTPISELIYWEEVELEFNNLLEQIKTIFVLKLLKKQEEYKADTIEIWSQLITEIKEFYSLAKENSEYLQTLKDYLLNIKNQNDFKFILTLLPNMMVSLRHIWTMSNYYCLDNNMQILLQKISYVFTEKVKALITLDDIFNNSAKNVYEISNNCANLLRAWKKSYTMTRSFIENSGIGSRWEFYKNILFADVDHIARISQDVSNVAKVFIEFENMFSNHLKSIVKEPEEIDNMLKKVYKLIDYVISIDYDVFRTGNSENWEATLVYFKKQVKKIEQEANIVLDRCINSLRSAEDGLELINDVKIMDTRESIVKHLSKKHDSIMRQFVIEIEIVEAEFLKNHENPPLQRNQTPNSGAIFWERLLYKHLKKSVLAFRKIENDPALENSYLKRTAIEQYFTLVKNMENYERDNFQNFLSRGTFIVNNCLKRNILKLEFCDNFIEHMEIDDKESITTTESLEIAKRHSAIFRDTKLLKPIKKGKFAATATAIKWLISRPLIEDPNLIMAEKFLARTDKDGTSHSPVDHFKVEQVKLYLKATKQENKPTWREVIEDSVLIDYKIRFTVNFSNEIFDIISEGQQFEYLGFKLSPVIRMAILRKESLFNDLEAVTEMILEYNKIIMNLSPAEVHFLKEFLYEAETIIQAGLGRYTWQTFNIKGYCNKCLVLLKSLTSMVSQISYISTDIRNRIKKIESYSLFSLVHKRAQKLEVKKRLVIKYPTAKTEINTNVPSEMKLIKEENLMETEIITKKVTISDINDVLECKKYFEKLDFVRNEKSYRIKKLYDSIGPILIKLESLILGTFTGDSEKMILYYSYWEKEAFACLIRLVNSNLKEFAKELDGENPLFQVDAILSSPEILLRPSAAEIYNIVIHSVMDFVERSKLFTLWMSGTCISCPPQYQGDEQFIFSFFEDLVQLPHVCQLVEDLQDSVQRLVADVRTYLVRWKKYKSLWMFDKTAICEKFVNKNLPLVKLDEKFLFYTQIIVDLEKYKPYFDVKGIRINLRPLITSIIEHAIEWRNTLGNILAERTRQNMFDLRNHIQSLRTDLDRNIKGLGDFKIVMQTISTIQTTTLTIEYKVKEMQETYSVLGEHNIKFPYSDMLMSYHLEKRWKKLFDSSFIRTKTLQPIKLKFSALTATDISEFVLNLTEFVNKFEVEGPGAVSIDMDSGIELTEHYASMFNSLEEQRLELVNAEKLFDIPLADYSDFLRVKKNFEGMQLIFKLYRNQKNARDTWSKTLWSHLNPQALVDGIDNFLKDFKKFPRWIRFMPIGQMLDIKMKQFKNSVPLMVNLKNDALRERHWKLLMEKTGQFFDMSPERFTLENMFAMELHKYQEIAEEIINNAIKELTIEQGVQKISNIWDVMNFSVEKYFKGGKEIGYILGNVEEILQVLEDNTMNLQEMTESEYIDPFLQNVLQWENCLTLASEIIDEWICTQNKWLCLEGIFMNDNVRILLPDEATKFDNIDKIYKKIMMNCVENPLVFPNCMINGRFSEFQNLCHILDICQKSLDDYLDSKKRIFPRFYFISANELLLLLGSCESNCIQELMIKMFDNIKSLKLTEDKTGRQIATAMISDDQEIMEFIKPIYTEGRIEDWLNEILIEMRKTNRFLTKRAIYDYGQVCERTRIEWIMIYQGMICIAANQVWWTAEVEEVFSRIKKGNKRAMKEFLEQQNKQINELIVQVRTDLKTNDRLKFKTIMTVDVHARDIIEAFVKEGILEAQDFEWERQLRFYWLKDLDNLFVTQCAGRFDYGYEYIGINGRLVVTPLTDRLFLSITQSLKVQLGGALIGLTASGKTETIKDLGKLMALLCIVTNCSDEMDFKSIGQILLGLTSCGAWGCFDEFNRIDVSVLSVISTQLQTIRSALLMKLKRFDFQGISTILDHKIGIFITMNTDYSGRNELPESIKALFRPISCIVPDKELICCISLYSDGFLTAKILAKKMTVLYDIAEKQLSKQKHYDWSLRSLKCVLRMAGVMKTNYNDISEAHILMRTIRDINITKLTVDDVPLFLGLIKDLFPGIDCTRIVYPDFNKAIKEVLQLDGYILISSQKEKIVQMYETMMTRHSVMIIGPTCGGKSVIINTLIKAQNLIGISTKCIVLNPNTCSVQELYGYLEPNTRYWIDGLFSNIFREINQTNETEEKRYICFDGEVDSLWIENMNSVMDDNKLLNLANGERIRLGNNCSLIFEVGNLSLASPASISRAGMVYVDPINLGYKPFWKKWILNRPEIERGQFQELYDRFVPPSINFIVDGLDIDREREPLQRVLNQTNLSMVIQLCYVLDSLIPISEITLHSSDIIQCVFIQSLYCSLGATLLSKSQLIFDEFIKKLLEDMERVEDTFEKPATSFQIPLTKPTLYEYFFDQTKEMWIAWEWLLPNYLHDRKMKFGEILVPTIDTLRTDWILNMMNNIKRPVLFVGDTGTGKTAIISNYLRNVNCNLYSILKINFSSRTTSMDVQRIIESSVEKRTKTTFGPPIRKKLIIFIDDLNMPKNNEPIALLKLFFEKGGMWNRDKNLKWKEFKDIVQVGAMEAVGDGRQNVDPRFISMFSIYNLLFPNDKTLMHIYNSILKGHLELFSTDLMLIADKLTEMTLVLFKETLIEFPPTPSKYHYIFNLKDLSRIYAGLLLTDVNNFKDQKHLVRVWRNEFTRVISDRFIYQKDIELMKGKIAEKIVKYFRKEPAPNLSFFWSSHTTMQEPEIIEIPVDEFALRDPLLYGDFRNAVNKGEKRFYEDLLDYEAIFFLFQEILEEYNLKRGKLNLILFENFLEHLTRVHRTLRMNKGHALLIGINGTGKQSLTKLAAFAAECEIFQITVCRGYNENSFRNDLKLLYNKIGIENKKTVFLITNSQIIEEGFLENINNILTVGFVPGLFTDDERNEIIKNCKENNQENDGQKTKEEIWTYFLRRCVENLHVVLSMSPIGDSLRNYCRNFPGLVGNSSIDWIFPWSEEALLAIAKVFLAEHPKIPEPHREPIVNHVVHVHRSLEYYSKKFLQTMKRQNFATPKHFLNNIYTYLKLIDERENFIIKQSSRLSDGINKINDASEQIIQLSSMVEEQQKNVISSKQKCELITIGIEDATNAATKNKEEASERSAEIEQKSRQLTMERSEIELALSYVVPPLEEAIKDLGILELSDVLELKNLTPPPEPVQIISECIVILKGIKELSWRSVKIMMTEEDFIKNLLQLNLDFITVKQIAQIRNHMKKTTKLDDVKSISIAGFYLVNYVKAVVRYCDTFREVKPKKERVKYLEEEIEIQTKILKELQKEIQELESTLIDLNKKSAAAIEEKIMLAEMLEQAERRLEAAEKLITGLSSEKNRWKIEFENLKIEKHNLYGTCLLSSSFLSYAGAFCSEFRRVMVYEDWIIDIKQREIPITIPFNIETILSNEMEIRTWTKQGLPNDSFTIQNGILTRRSSKFPFCIDPQQQALEWIKKWEEQNNLKIIKFSDKDFLRQLELSILAGLPVLFEDVDDNGPDPVIDNILEKNIKIEAGRQYLMLGDKEINVDDNFRMYLTTKLTHPIFEPSVYAKTTVINCTITVAGLENQLLSVIIKEEHSIIEEQYERLISEMSIHKQLLEELDDLLLKELQTANGNMLDNTEMIKTLENTKTKISKVQIKLEVAEETIIDINKLRYEYYEIAKIGADLFFVLSEMSMVHLMYQYSLMSFLEVFLNAIKKANTDSVVIIRISNIIKILIKIVYDYGCMGIYEKHKLLFSFQMITKLEKSKGNLKQNQLNFFIRGSHCLDENLERESPVEWISSNDWRNILKLSTEFMETFGEIPNHIEQNLDEWKKWYVLKAPEEIDLPGGFSKKMTEFDILIFLRCLRIDRVFCAVNNYIINTMGEEFIIPPVLSFDGIYEQTNFSTPIVFIISPGFDPTSDLMRLSDKCGSKDGFKYISLGQGQENAVSGLIDVSIENGYWLMLQNCHLSVTFMRRFEKILDKIERKSHPNFRLWITTEPNPLLPIGILQRSLKVNMEPPTGLKLNLRSTFTKLHQETCAHNIFKPLVFVLTFFHAVIQERRKYKKFGWNISYDFNESDLNISIQILKTYLTNVITKKETKIPWNNLKYLIGEIIYGGRVYDDFDQRIINVYMDEYLGDFLFDSCQPFHFYKDKFFSYKIPSDAESATRENFIENINKFPLANLPEVYGLDSNVNIEYYTNAVSDIWTYLIDLQPQTEETNEEINRDDFIDTIAMDILKKLPKVLDVLRLKKGLQMKITPIAVVLIQELEHYNILVNRIKLTLEDLRKAIVGKISVDFTLDEISNSLFKKKLPNDWRKLAPETCKQLGDWIDHLQRRGEQYKHWSLSGEPMVMWLAGLHIPESYLTALIQIACRKNNWLLDKSTIFTYVTQYIDPDDIEERAVTGCYITGLYLEGARWCMKNMCLKKSYPKILVEPLPILSVVPMQVHQLKLLNTFRTPVYTTSERKNKMGEGLMFEADLGTTEHINHWILKNVCLTLNT